MALIKCPECGKEVSDSAQNCPGCGYPLIASETTENNDNSLKNSTQVNIPIQPTKKKKSGCLVGCLTAVVIFILFIAIIAVIGGNSTSDSTKTDMPTTEVAKETGAAETTETEATSVAETEAKKEKLEIISYENLNEGSLRYVTGQVKNNTDKNYSYVQIEIKMYKDDVVLGTALDNMNNLGPEETWQFKALITDNSCNRYTIVGVTGF